MIIEMEGEEVIVEIKSNIGVDLAKREEIIGKTQEERKMIKEMLEETQEKENLAKIEMINIMILRILIQKNELSQEVLFVRTNMILKNKTAQDKSNLDQYLKK